MSFFKITAQAIPSAVIVLGAALAGGAATAGPLPNAHAAATDGAKGAAAQDVRYRGWGGGGVGIYIGPSYGTYPRYGYGYRDYDYGYRSYGYYPRYSYYDDRYDRRYRTHSRRWVQERFEHPLGRR